MARGLGPTGPRRLSRTARVAGIILALATLASCRFTLVERPGAAIYADAMAQRDAKQYGAAAQSFEQALGEATSPKLRAQALYELGRLELNGTGVLRDPEAALHHFREAMAAGHLGASIAVAECYRDGLGVDQDDEQAAAIVRPIAEQSPDAALLLAGLIKNGRIQAREQDEAATLLASAIDGLRRIGAQGDGQAFVQLAQLYREGWLVNRDMPTAEGYYMEAVSRGDVAAALELGQLWTRGQGTYSPAEGIALLLDAADAGAPAALPALSRELELGFGGPAGLEQVMKWLEPQAEAGNTAAMVALGRLLLQRQDAAAIAGLPPEQRLDKGNSWLMRASTAGDPQGALELANAYSSGLAVQGTATDIVQLYQRAADAGLAEAQFNLAMCYATGWGTERDPDKARVWFRRATLGGLSLNEAFVEELLGAPSARQ